MISLLQSLVLQLSVLESLTHGIDRWSNFADLTVLRTLHLSATSSHDLAWMSSFQFDQLESFTIWSDAIFHGPNMFESAVVAFMLGLPRIGRIRLHEKYSQANLGRLVRTDSFVDMSFVDHLPDFTEELGLGLYRWAESSAELHFYRKLRKLNLRTVQLSICTVQAVTDDAAHAHLKEDEPPEISFLEPKLHNSSLAMRDLAFDEPLARLIFDAIRPLERLTLLPKPAVDERRVWLVEQYALSYVLKESALSW